MATSRTQKRRTKLITPVNVSFANCVDDHLFTRPLHGLLNDFKPIVYLDEQGRRHGRVTDHLLQQQIEIDRQNLKNKSTQKVLPSSRLYGVRNPNIVALVSDAPVDNDDASNEEEMLASSEVKFIEYKQPTTDGRLKGSHRQISSTDRKQSVTFDIGSFVDMTQDANDDIASELGDIDGMEHDNDDDRLAHMQHIVCYSRMIYERMCS
jgi:hypothetical protein